MNWIISLFKGMNWNSAKAAGKHVASFIAGGITIAVGFHFVSPSDGADLQDNFNHLYHAIEEGTKAIAGIISILTLAYTTIKSANNASPVNQAKSLQAAVPNTVIVTSAEIAKATPDNPNIVSNTEAKVVTK